jgi:hypothetical protein
MTYIARKLVFDVKDAQFEHNDSLLDTGEICADAAVP